MIFTLYIHSLWRYFRISISFILWVMLHTTLFTWAVSSFLQEPQVSFLFSASHKNLIRLNKSKCRVLHLVRAVPGMSTDWEKNPLRAALRRRAWGFWWMKSWTWPGNACSQPRMCCAASKEAWLVGWGKILPLLCSHKFCVQPWHPQNRKVKLEWDLRRAVYVHPQGSSGWERWGSLARKREGWRLQTLVYLLVPTRSL